MPTMLNLDAIEMNYERYAAVGLAVYWEHERGRLAEMMKDIPLLVDRIRKLEAENKRLRERSKGCVWCKGKTSGYILHYCPACGAKMAAEKEGSHE